MSICIQEQEMVMTPPGTGGASGLDHAQLAVMHFLRDYVQYLHVYPVHTLGMGSLEAQELDSLIRSL